MNATILLLNLDSGKLPPEQHGSPSGNDAGWLVVVQSADLDTSAGVQVKLASGAHTTSDVEPCE